MYKILKYISQLYCIINNVVISIIDTSNVHSVSRRIVKPEKSDQIPLKVITMPGGNGTYNNPSFPEVKYPVQATQVEEDGASMEMATSAQYRFTRHGSNVPSTTSYYFSGSNMASRSNVPMTSFNSGGASNYSFGASSSQTSIQSDSRSTQSATPPKYVNYTTYESRLLTFNSLSWLVSEKPDKHIFAEEGFFFTGTPVYIFFQDTCK